MPLLRYFVFVGGALLAIAAGAKTIEHMHLISSDTAIRAGQCAIGLSLAFNVNYARVPERRVLSVDPSAPTHRADDFLGVQEAFVDYHLRDVSDRYDFDSIRGRGFDAVLRTRAPRQPCDGFGETFAAIFGRRKHIERRARRR